MEHVVRELVHAMRMLARRPGWTAHAVLTLALGIGAATAVFTVASGVLFRPLPLAEPHRLVALTVSHRERSPQGGALTPGRYLDVRDSVRSFHGTAALRLLTANLATEHGAERVRTAWVTSSASRRRGPATCGRRSIAR